MKKAAVRKTTTTAGSNVEQAFEVFNAKQQFYASALNMSWQLALTVVIPVVAGVKLDEKFDSSPSLTLTGFFLATAAAGVVVWNTVKGITKLQTEEDEKEKKRKKRA